MLGCINKQASRMILLNFPFPYMEDRNVVEHYQHIKECMHLRAVHNVIITLFVRWFYLSSKNLVMQISENIFILISKYLTCTCM